MSKTSQRALAPVEVQKKREAKQKAKRKASSNARKAHRPKK